MRATMHFLVALVLALCGGARAQTVGLHTVSIHAPQNIQHNRNWGGYYRTAERLEFGAFRNSYGRTSLYAGQGVTLAEGTFGRLGLDLGLVSGYQTRCTAEACTGFSRGAITPMLAAEYTAPLQVLGVTPRVQFVPPIGKHAAVFHLTAEIRIGGGRP